MNAPASRPSPAACDTPAGFATDAALTLPAWAHASGCRCALHQRRRLAGGLAAVTLAATGVLPADAQQGKPVQEGVGADVGSESRFSKLVSAEDVESAAQQQYAQMKKEASSQRALAPDNHPQVVRLRSIAQRIIPFTTAWNRRARDWRWEVNLFGSKELNAFCMPGGKIAFYYGILQRLQLSDDEVAMIMGHEMAHALREHARERMGKTAATKLGAGLLSSLLGLGNLGNTALDLGGQFLTLKFSRDDESEADLVGLELAARAGYNPEAGVSLWQKMLKAAEGAPPEFMSTHPSGPTRIRDIQATLPKVEGLYARAPKPSQRFEPPKPA